MAPIRPLRNIPSLVVVFAFVCVLSVGWLSTARAEPANSGWVTETPQLNVEPAAANSVGASECTTKPVTYTLTDLSDVTANGGSWTKTDNLCVMEGNTVDVARNSRGIMYVRPHADTTFRLLRGSVRARLTPGTNTYTYIDDAAVGKLWIVRNLTPVLQPDETSPLGELLSYRLAPDVATPLFLNADQPGGYHHVYSYAVSRDTNTLIAYVDFMGIVRLNLTNNVAMKIAQPGGADHDTVDNPKVLAVSNDGRYVFLSSFLTLIDTIDNCGEPFVLPFSQAHPLASPCPSRNFDYLVTSQIPYSFRASDASFTDGATTLAFITSSDGSAGSVNDTAPRKVTLSISTSAPLQLDYLALGDSFSSGEGDLGRDPKTNLKYYREHTDDDGTAMVDGFTDKVRPREKCHISTNSYPYHLAQGMDLGLPTSSSNTTSWQSVACAGATAWDVKEQGSDEYEGQGDGGQPRLQGYNVAELKTQALNEFIPGRQKQIEFVKKYQPKVITLTMGGNDINFAGKMRECVQSPATCPYATDEWRARLKNEIYGQFNNLTSLYHDISDATNGKSKVYVIGYPVYVNADPASNCSANLLFLNLKEREMIVNSIVYLNNIIEAAAKNAGVTYVDIEHAFGNHRLCDSGEGHVNAITGVLGYGGDELQESFHPNSNGQVDMTNAVWDFVGGSSLLDYITCPNTPQRATCPDNSIDANSAIMPPYFLDTESDTNTTVTYYALTNGVLIKSVEHNGVNMGESWFEPESEVNATLYSTPTHLGKFITNKDGNLYATIAVPASVPAGYHRLSITGTAIDGRPIEAYQTVLVQGINSNDVDEDGVLDEYDRCIYGLPIDDSVNVMRDVGCVSESDIGEAPDAGASVVNDLSNNTILSPAFTSSWRYDTELAQDTQESLFKAKTRAQIKQSIIKKANITYPAILTCAAILIIASVIVYAKTRRP